MDHLALGNFYVPDCFMIFLTPRYRENNLLLHKRIFRIKDLG